MNCGLNKLSFFGFGYANRAIETEEAEDITSRVVDITGAGWRATSRDGGGWRLERVGPCGGKGGCVAAVAPQLPNGYA